MLIGLDAGTSVVKAVAFTDDGDVLRTAARATVTHSPAPGLAEQDIEAVIAAAVAALREVAAGEAPDLLGITAQGDGVWLLDAAGRPVRPAILWSDARAAVVVDRWMADGTAERAFRRSGNMLFPGAAAPVLAYLQEHDPAPLEVAATAGYCKDAIVQRLTGVRATDVSDASLPFFDPRTRRYDRELLDAFGLAQWAHLLAPVDPSPAPLRPLTAAAADLTGIPAGTLVHGGPFDLCATAIGAGLEHPGDGLIVIGTTLGCGVLTDHVETTGVAAGMLLCLSRPDRWLRVMPAMVGTPSLEWLLALVGGERSEIDDLLAASPVGAHGVICLPLLSPSGERAPFVDPAARGQLLGLSLESTRADLVRAVCEGVAYAARHCLEAAGMIDDGRIFLGGGGVRSTGWRQMLADVLGRPLLLARQPEAGARGAALAALDAAGVPHDRAAWTRPDGVIEPDPAAVAHYREGYAFYRDRLDAARGHWRGPAWPNRRPCRPCATIVQSTPPPGRRRRARMATIVHQTAADLLTLPDDGWRYELIRGEVERMPPDNIGHGTVTQNLLLPLLPFVHARRLGSVLVNVGFTLEQHPDTVLSPDVSFVRAERLPEDEESAFPTLAPDLAVEILSPSNRAGEMARKLAIYLAAGVPLIWFIDKRSRSVVVHTSAGAVLLAAGDTLDGGAVLPGFALPVADLFA